MAGVFRRLAPFVGAFALGAATATAVFFVRAEDAPPVRIVYVERSATPTTQEALSPSAAAPSVVPSTSPGPSLVARPPSSPSRAPPSPPPASASGSLTDRLAAERAVLDVARAGLASGDPTRALAAVTRHEREFPRGVLTEEREAIAVKALIATGRVGEARARGAQFRERFPRSILLHAVESSLESVP